MSNKFYDIIIVGAGASGMMAAITAARNDKRVLLLERKDKVGKKILATGNGKCNFTNEDMDLSHFNGDKELIKNVLGQFSMGDCLSFFREIGVFPKSKNGYYYPNSETATSLLEALLMEIKALGIEIVTEADIRDIFKKKNKFDILCGNDNYRCNSLIIATGLLANPKLGSDGSIFPIVKELGHGFTTLVPALCGFFCKGIDFKKVSGVRCEAIVTLYVEDQRVASDHGELQLADYGVSGIPVFQISRHASKALTKKRKCEIGIDLMPSLDKQELFNELDRRKQRVTDDRTIADLLNGLFNHKLIPVLLDNARVQIKKSAKQVTEKELYCICDSVKELRVVVDKPRDYDFAQVCAGGVRTGEIDTMTLESKIVPDLYFAGEILDVDGICGGYNLQWAWSSGFVAGNNACR